MPIMSHWVSNMCVSTENSPKRESVWRRGRSSWSFGGSNRLRGSWLGTWSGSAKQVSLFCQTVRSGLSNFRCQKIRRNWKKRPTLSLSVAAEEVLLEEEDEIAEEKSPLDGAWYKRTQNLSGKKPLSRDVNRKADDEPGTQHRNLFKLTWNQLTFN